MLVESGMFNFFDYSQRRLKFVESLALMSYHSVGLATKLAVNFGLFGGTIVGLGRSRFELYIAYSLVFLIRLDDCQAPRNTSGSMSDASRSSTFAEDSPSLNSGMAGEKLWRMKN